MKPSSINKFRYPFILPLLAFLHIGSAVGLIQNQDSVAADPDPLRFKEEISAFISWDQKNSFPADAVLFVGSSSIRLWNTHDGFPDYPLINRGFSGAHISDVLYYYDRVIKKYQPQLIVFYAGDNDVAAGKSAEQVCNDFIKLYTLVQNDQPATKVVFLTIKPSLSRWIYWEEMQKTNILIENYARGNLNLSIVDVATPLLGREGYPDACLFTTDSLHLNEEGYTRWEKVLYPVLEKLTSRTR